MEIMIIGTNPPCPRCDIMDLWVEEIIAEKKLCEKVHVAHHEYSDLEAIAVGVKKGRKVGTAKHVAAAAGLQFDKEIINQWTEQRMNEIECYTRPADLWNKEFDRILEKFQEAAEGVLYLMTPILVIDGEVKHSGSVPEKNQIEKWIEESL